MRTQIANFQCIVENPGQSNAVVMFHGFGADYSDLASLADMMDPDGDWTWIFPNGPTKVDIGGGMTGRAWFPIDIEALNQSLITGVPRDYAAAEPPEFNKILPDLKFFIEELKTQYPRLVLGGFSQGGMIATHLLGTAGASLCGAILLSTVLFNQKALEASLIDTPAKSFFESHGSRDPMLHIKYGQMLYQFLKKKGWKASWLDFPGGHEIPMPVMAKASIYLKSLLGSTEA
jgi:phospholipase/carboxylesterase